MNANVVAIDDHEVALAGLHHMLQFAQDCTLVGAYHTVREALAHLHDPALPRPDAVLLDLRLHDGSDPFINATVLQEAGLPVLIYSSLESPYLVRRALHAGVVGVVEKSARAEDIIAAIHLAARGRVYVTAEWAGIIDSDPLIDTVDLSDRQREVLELYAMGESAKRVASILELSPETVQDYLGRIRTKYALAGRPANSKVELFRRAQEDGFLPGPVDR